MSRRDFVEPAIAATHGGSNQPAGNVGRFVASAPLGLAVGLPVGALMMAAAIGFRVNGADEFAEQIAEQRVLFLVANGWILSMLFFLPPALLCYRRVGPGTSAVPLSIAFIASAGLLVAISCCLNLLIGTTIVPDYSAAAAVDRGRYVDHIWYVHVASDNLFLLGVSALGAGFVVAGTAGSIGSALPAWFERVALAAGLAHLVSIGGFVWLPIASLQLLAQVLQAIWFGYLGIACLAGVRLQNCGRA